MGDMRDFPVPGDTRASVVVPAPAPGPGNWVGAPSAAFDDDGSIVLAYRVRSAAQRGSSVVLARSHDGETFTTELSIEKDRFGAESLERPAVVKVEGRWYLYLSCATPTTKHWRIDLLEAPAVSQLQSADLHTVFAGDRGTGVKDPVVRRIDNSWHAWICCHPLDTPGEEDRMTTGYATSADGRDWDWHGTVLLPRRGAWDCRGTRVTAVLPNGTAYYDGRTSKEENFSERTGIALSDRQNQLTPAEDGPIANVRYLDVLPLPEGGFRLYYEAPLADQSHELRTELVRF